MVIICVVIGALVWLITVHPVSLPVAIACLVLLYPVAAHQSGAFRTRGMRASASADWPLNSLTGLVPRAR